MRGIHLEGVIILRHTGITPACAGNTLALSFIAPNKEDHPRVCGEYAPLSIRQSTRRGSPPRVRGIRLRYKGHDVPYRITPACAGNTHQQVTQPNQI